MADESPGEEKQRLLREVEHGRFLAVRGAGRIWNWESPAGSLRRERRLGLLTSILRPGMDVLELGCGTGIFSREIAKRGVRLTAIDISWELLSIAKGELSGAAVRLCLQNACKLGFRDGTFDAVVGSSVLHHLAPEPALRECLRVLKPGGRLCLAEPNMLNPQIALQKNIPFLKRMLGDSPDETAFFRWQAAATLRRVGFSAIEVQPFDWLHPCLPEALLPFFNRLGLFLERLLLIREFAGSLLICGIKPEPKQLELRGQPSKEKAPPPDTQRLRFASLRRASMSSSMRPRFQPMQTSFFSTIKAG